MASWGSGKEEVSVQLSIQQVRSVVVDLMEEESAKGEDDRRMAPAVLLRVVWGEGCRLKEWEKMCAKRKRVRKEGELATERVEMSAEGRKERRERSTGAEEGRQVSALPMYEVVQLLLVHRPADSDPPRRSLALSPSSLPPPSPSTASRFRPRPVLPVPAERNASSRLPTRHDVRQERQHERLGGRSALGEGAAVGVWRRRRDDAGIVDGCRADRSRSGIAVEL